MDEAVELATRHVRELLEAHWRDARCAVTQQVAGKVSVTVDARLQVTAVRILDSSIDEGTRHELEKAVIEAVNGAQRQAVTSAAEAVSRLHESTDWKAAMDGLLRGERGAKRGPASAI